MTDLILFKFLVSLVLPDPDSFHFITPAGLSETHSLLKENTNNYLCFGVENAWNLNFGYKGFCIGSARLNESDSFFAQDHTIKDSASQKTELITRVAFTVYLESIV